MPSELDIDRDSPMKNRFRELTPWCPWSERTTLTGQGDALVTSLAGVYLLAHFDELPRGSADFLDPHIIYVGEGGNLGSRWGNFDGAARTGDGNHSGGRSYFREYGCDQWSRLHIAALPIWFGDGEMSLEPWTRNFRHAAERLILWRITVATDGQQRLLNRK